MKSEREIKVIIVGAGGHALVIADILVNLKEYNLVGFLEKDDVFNDLNARTKRITSDTSAPIFSDSEIFREPLMSENCKIVLGLGQELVLLREDLVKKFNNSNFSFCSAIHLGAIIAPSAIIGEGAVVMAGAIVNPFAKIGNHVVVNTGAVVDHECVIGENAFIQPGAHLGGNVRIGQNSIIGIGANVKEDIEIGSNSIIGGGAFVNKDVGDNVVCVGVPAKKITDNLLKEGVL